MSKKRKTSFKRVQKALVPGVQEIRTKKTITEYLITANKMGVLYVHIPGSPTVTTNIVYRVGSQHEVRGETGLAHMLEHMLFKPLKDKSALTWKDLEEKGAILNANTWLDRTSYFFNMPKKYLGHMLEVESKRMQEVDLRDKEFIPERTNVLSEYHMYDNRPEAALDRNMVSTAFQSHGYKHETIGFKEDIESYTTEKLQHFYDENYSPQNATLIVAGDIDEKELLSTIKKYFGQIKNKKELRRHISSEPPQEGQRKIVLERETPVRFMQVAFKGPAFLDKDWLPLYVGLNYLANGNTSILYKKLVETKKASSVSAILYPTQDPFLINFEIYATESTPYIKIEEILFDTIFNVIKKEIPKAKVVELREQVYAEELFSRDGSYSIASNLVEYVATGDWTKYFDDLERTRKITREDIQSAFRKYLVPSRSTIGSVVNPSKA